MASVAMANRLQNQSGSSKHLEVSISCIISLLVGTIVSVGMQYALSGGYGKATARLKINAKILCTCCVGYSRLLLDLFLTFGLRTLSTFIAIGMELAHPWIILVIRA
jgi:hypothetical protein